MKASLPPAIFLMGPTASGKTALAVCLAEQLPCEIISVDSAMVYRGMDIGTAKPDQDILAKAPHRLIDIRDPAESYSAAQFRADALVEMAEITRMGRLPLLVGGTMLYFRALEQGLSSLPGADKAVRSTLEKEAEQKGWPAMHEKLRRIDPRAASQIHPNDPQRIQRALEVFELSGKTMTELIDSKDKVKLPYRVLKIGLMTADRKVLHQRIEDRFQEMLDHGFLCEVEALHQRGDLNSGLPAIRAVGYRQLWAYLDGQYSYHEAVTRGVIATRQLAKRQMTWLRSEQAVNVLASENENNLVKTLKLLTDATIN